MKSKKTKTKSKIKKQLKLNSKTNKRKMNDYDFLYKFLLIGDSGVGKSSLLMRFSEHMFSESISATIGIDFCLKTIDIDGKIAKLQIWDTCGQERFKSITASYYRGAHCVLVVYDVSNRISFENVQMWLSELKKNCPECMPILIANKCDVKERAVPHHEGADLANKLGILYYETSAKTNDNDLKEIFTEVSKILIRKRIPSIQNKKITPITTNTKKINQCFC